MRLDRFIAKSRIIEIESPDLPGALMELLRVSTYRLSDELDTESIARALLEREHTMTTYLGNGVAMPHIRVRMKRPYMFAIGRCPNGLDHEGMEDYRQVRLVFLLLAAENEQNYLHVLAALARIFRSEKAVNHMLLAPDTKTFQERVFDCFGNLQAKEERPQSRFNRLFLKEAEKVARDCRCAGVLLFTDTFAGALELPSRVPRHRTILVSRTAIDKKLIASHNIETCIEVRTYSKHRLSQLRSAILIGLTRSIFKFTDRLCCVGGIPGSNQLDTLVVIDIEREFHSVMARESELLPSCVKIEVVERMIAIATELAVEGREGRPVGSLFVIGDTERVNTMVKPLVLNPFHGYPDEDRNVLNPFMDETIKEFSVIDGCFVIRGDGKIESAGSLIHAPSEFYKDLDLPSGYGSRHTAAAAISRAADCVALVVSASSGQVSLFRKGVMLPLLEKPMGSGDG